MTSWFDDEMDRNDRLWARMSPAEREAATNRAATKRAGVEPGDQDTLNNPMFKVHPDGHVTIVNVRETAHVRSELDQYQHEAMATSGDHGRPPESEHMKWIVIAALGLAGEAGEVADLYKKEYEQDRPIIRDKLVKELGDVLWYIARIGAIEGISLSEIASANLAKLRARYPNGFVSGGGVR